MRIFFVGAFDVYRDYKFEVLLKSFGVEDRLVSYAFLRVYDNIFFVKMKRAMDKVLQNNLYNDVMLDSGAFTAAFKDVDITVDDYLQFLDDFKFDYIIGLDKIPFDKEKGFTQKLFLESAEETYQNCKLIQDRGIENIPTFHQGEPYDALKRLCDEFDFVALGISSRRIARADIHYLHLDKCFSIIPKTTRVHGLAMTDFNLPLIYPFYSVDSSTWEREARYGKIKIRMFDEYATIGLTERLRNSVTKHYDFVLPEVRKECDKYLAELGTNVDKCRDSHVERYFVNIQYYNRLLREKKVRKYKSKELF